MTGEFASDSTVQQPVVDDVPPPSPPETRPSLKAFEERFQAWQAAFDATVSNLATDFPATPPVEAPAPAEAPQSNDGLPSSEDLTLKAAWQMFNRARELLEAEQAQVCENRLVLRDAELALEQREADLAARELRLAERERQLLEVSTEAAKKGKFVGAAKRAARSIFHPAIS